MLRLESVRVSPHPSPSSLTDHPLYRELVSAAIEDLSKNPFSAPDIQWCEQSVEWIQTPSHLKPIWAKWMDQAANQISSEEPRRIYKILKGRDRVQIGLMTQAQALSYEKTGISCTCRNHSSIKKPQHIYTIQQDGQLKEESTSHTQGPRKCVCVPLNFSNIILLSRMYLAQEHDPQKRNDVVKALNQMADKVDAKYNSGLMGILKKICSYISNLFKSTSQIQFFRYAKILRFPSEIKDELPFWVGTDATYARLVALMYSPKQPSNRSIDQKTIVKKHKT